MSSELSKPVVIAKPADGDVKRETTPVMARGMSNEECVAAARMTMWRLPNGGRSR